MDRRSFIAAAGLSAAFGVRAQSYPDRPITVLVSFPPGGLADIQMRAAARIAEKRLGQSIVIENRPGAMGLFSANAMARTKPDGYTVFQITQNVYRAPHLGKVQFNPADFTYIIGMADFDHALFVGQNSPIKSLKDLVEMARKDPGMISIGTTGVASTGQLLLQDFSNKANVRLNHVPYKGAPELGSAIIGETLMAGIMPVSVGLKLGERLRMVAVFGEKRAVEQPAVATAKEQGYDSNARATFGIAGPKGLNPAHVKVLHDAFYAAMQDSSYQALLKQVGLLPWYKSSSEFSKWAADAVEVERRLVAAANLTAND